MTRRPAWISKSAVLAIHDRLIAEHGGAPGLLNEANLDAALAGPENHFAYDASDLFRLAAAYASGITRNHPFQDGNKRVALTAAGVFLELNGYRLEAPEPDAAAAMMALSTREIDDESFAAWLRGSSSKIAPVRRRRRTSARSRRRTR